MKTSYKLSVLFSMICVMFATQKSFAQVVDNNTTSTGCTLQFTATYVPVCSCGTTWTSNWIGNVAPNNEDEGGCTQTCTVASWAVTDGTNSYTVNVPSTTPVTLCGGTYTIHAGPASCAVQ